MNDFYDEGHKRCNMVSLARRGLQNSSGLDKPKSVPKSAPEDESFIEAQNMFLLVRPP
jgi:hypothetical protein